ncbi:MAG: hypothetical protein Q9216_006080 [Gyalolechia sp. 2 TL-2023]
MSVDKYEPRPPVPKTSVARPPLSGINMRPRPVVDTSQDATSPQGSEPSEGQNLGYRSPSGLPAPLRILPPFERTDPSFENPRRRMPPPPVRSTDTRWPGTDPAVLKYRTNMSNHDIPILRRPSQRSPTAPRAPSPKVPPPPLRILTPPPRKSSIPPRVPTPPLKILTPPRRDSLNPPKVQTPAPKTLSLPLRTTHTPSEAPAAQKASQPPSSAPTVPQRPPRPLYRLFPNPSHQPEKPNFSRLDIPNEDGRNMFVYPSGQLGLRYYRSNATSQVPVSMSPDQPLQFAQYDKFPMVIQIEGRPCILYGPPWTKDAGKVMSGDESFLSEAERQERKVCRARAHEDLRDYGSPTWLAQDLGEGD